MHMFMLNPNKSRVLFCYSTYAKLPQSILFLITFKPLIVSKVKYIVQ